MYRTPANHRPQTLLPGQTCTAKVKQALRRQQNLHRSLKARTEAKATNPDIRSSLKQPGPQDFGTLIFVTALWGSYNPTIRWLYDTDHPLSPSTLTAIRTVWAAGALAVAIACSNNRSLPAASPSLPDQAEPQGSAGGAAGISQPAVQAACQAELPLLARTVNNVVVAGVELGTYNFLGTSLQAVGLQLTSATRAGFLVQLTAVLVPLLSALAGVPISPRIWAAALMALAGTCLVALDGAKPTITADSTSLAAASDIGEMLTTSASSSSSSSSGLAAVAAPSAAAVAQQQQLLDPSGTITSGTDTSAPSVVHSSSSGSGGAGVAMAAEEAHSGAASAVSVVSDDSLAAAAAAAAAGAGVGGDAGSVLLSPRPLGSSLAPAAPLLLPGSAPYASGPGGDSSLLDPHLTPAAWPLTNALGGDLGVSSLTHLPQAPAGLLDSAVDMGDAGLAGSLLAGSLAQATADLTAAGTSGLEGGSALGATLTQAVVTMAGQGVEPAAAAGWAGAAGVAVGDLYLLAACCFYSLATVRLGFHAPLHQPVQLAAVKKFTLGAASLAWLASTTQQQGAGGLAGVGAAMAEQTPLDWLLIIYSALGPGALATYLQTRGQVVVPATLAQVVFSLTPLWSALIAALVLGDDGMGQAAWAGSAAILVASAVATDGQTTTRTQAGAAGREAAAAAAAAAGEGGGAGGGLGGAAAGDGEGGGGAGATSQARGAGVKKEVVVGSTQSRLR
ncbi:hypothetical protein QJQ45_014158 [Haematococcus lacustris]|nr:hypothetical protein QJQ45_014158 [Haematococcus lacustris]